MLVENTKLKKIEIQNAELYSPPPHSDELGGWKTVRNPAAILSAWGSAKKEANTINIKIPANELANDNQARKKLAPRLRTACLVFSAFLLGAFTGINSSAIATQTVMQANDQMLMTTMEASPQTLAHVLNAMDVGATE